MASELSYVKPQRRQKPKGPTARRIATRRRAEGPVIRAVRAACVERDGHCRVGKDEARFCATPSEWAHLENHRRGRTRNMKPELRHTTAGSAMLCRFHHREYDAGRLRIASITGLGADGPLTWRTV